MEKNAAAGIGINDQQYEEVGAVILSTPEDIFNHSDLIIKVKEP